MKFLENFKPMLLDEKTHIFDDPAFLFELKYDGYRALIHVSPKIIKIYSRNGHDLTKNFPELQSIKEIVKGETIFDGEIVSFIDGRPKFSDLQTRGRIKNDRLIQKKSLENPVVFVAFDCLYKNGKMLIAKSLEERKKILDKFSENDNFIKNNFVIGKGIKLFNKVKKLDLEGVVAKRIDSKYYINTRSKDWIKIKNYKLGEFYIGGYVETDFKRSLLIGEYRHDGKLYFIGKVSVDKSLVFNSEIINKSVFDNFKEKNCHYLKKLLKCEIKYIGRTENDNLREPVFKRMV